MLPAGTSVNTAVGGDVLWRIRDQAEVAEVLEPSLVLDELPELLELAPVSPESSSLS